jgi:large subunit ribosomal protein L31e
LTQKQRKQESKKPEEKQEQPEQTLKEEKLEETIEETPEEETKKETEETPIEAEIEEEKPAEEETKPAKEKKPKEEEEIVEERTYTVPLAKAWIMPPRKRAPRAMRMLKTFITKHMKLEKRKEAETEEEEEEPKKLTITEEVNEKLWTRGIEKPPRKIRVRATKDKDGNVTVYLAEGD